jgi:hypothetical protein
VAELLAAHPAAIDAVAGLLGCDGDWLPLGQAVPSDAGGAGALLARHPATAVAVAELLCETGGGAASHPTS